MKNILNYIRVECWYSLISKSKFKSLDILLLSKEKLYESKIMIFTINKWIWIFLEEIKNSGCIKYDSYINLLYDLFFFSMGSFEKLFLIID